MDKSLMAPCTSIAMAILNPIHLRIISLCTTRKQEISGGVEHLRIMETNSPHLMGSFMSVQRLLRAEQIHYMRIVQVGMFMLCTQKMVHNSGITIRQHGFQPL